MMRISIAQHCICTDSQTEMALPPIGRESHDPEGPLTFQCALRATLSPRFSILLP
jgi:hypothetical protein